MKRQACSQDKRPGKQDKTLSRSIKKRRPESLRMHPLFFRHGCRCSVFPCALARTARACHAVIAVVWWMGANNYTPFCEGPAVFPLPLPLGSSALLLPPPTVPGTTVPNRPPPRPAGPHRPAPRRRCPSPPCPPLPFCHSPATAPPRNRIDSTKIFNSILNSELPPPGSPQQLAPPRAALAPPSRRPDHAAQHPAPRLRIATPRPRLLNVRAPYYR